MYRSDRNPAWFRDLKWLSAILLVLSLAATTLFFSLSQLTSRGQSQALIRQVLEFTLLPEGSAEAAVAVRQGVAYQPGEPLVLLPGVSVVADASEIATFSAEEAVSRIAGALADRVIQAGTGSVRELGSNAELTVQLEQAFATTVPLVVRSRMAEAMLPSGLDDGSRLADWPTQAAQKPGELVQPVVGVFVFAEPAELTQMSDREIGERVIELLADIVLSEGLPAAQAVVTNSNLQARLAASVDQQARADLHDLFGALLSGRLETFTSRLDQARVLLQEQDAPPEGLLGILSAEQLAGRTPEEANELVLTALAARAFEGGVASLEAVLTEAQQAERVRSVGDLIGGLSKRAHGRYLRYTWLFGIAALVFVASVAGFSSGWGRLVNVGLAMALSAAGGALLFTRLSSTLEGVSEAALPVSIRAEGIFAYLQGLVTYVGVNMPRSSVDLLVRNHLVVLAVGGGLVLLSLLIRLFGAVRSRGRSYL